MQPSTFRKYLSYVVECHVETVYSDYNETLEVLLKNGRYQLCTKNAVYSYADKYDNFRQCFSRLNLDKQGFKHVLLLGFGLGSIPWMLEKVFRKQLIYTGVEIDEGIIYLASKYVLDELDSEVTLVHADASNFVVQNRFMYDMICIDIFIDDHIPHYFLTKEFLMQVQTCLSSEGTILFNHLGHTHDDIEAAKNYFSTVFSVVFPDSQMMRVKKNFMMISHPHTWVIEK